MSAESKGFVVVVTCDIERVPAALCSSAIQRPRVSRAHASMSYPQLAAKISLIVWALRRDTVSEIKLIRTDTTL